jgi:hypothetical protein
MYDGCRTHVRRDFNMESSSNLNVGQFDRKEYDPPSSHSILIISSMFSMIGGALILLSGGLSWISEGSGWFLTDLVALNSSYNIYLVALLGGALVIVLSGICLLTERTHKSKIWPVTAIATAFVTTVIVATTAYWISGDMAMMSETASLGPAPFMAVFGCVLTLAGGSVLTMNTLNEVISVDTVTHVPMPGGVPAQVVEQELPRPTGTMKCPACKTPVENQWEICPVCGSGLKGRTL